MTHMFPIWSYETFVIPFNNKTQEKCTTVPFTIVLFRLISFFKCGMYFFINRRFVLFRNFVNVTSPELRKENYGASDNPKLNYFQKISTFYGNLVQI